MARIWIDDHGSGIGKSSKRVTARDAWTEMKAAIDRFLAQGYRWVDSTAGHIVMRCPRHVDGACAQINIQR